MNSILISSFPIMNSLWVTFHILWQAVSSHLCILPVCEWHCTFCERQFHHILACDQQQVSEVPYFCQKQSHARHLFLWPTASEWYCTFLDYILSNLYLAYQYILFIYISKWACCHIFSMSSLYNFIIIDCKISFQFTHSYLVWSSLSLILLALNSRRVAVLHELFSIGSYSLVWTFLHVWRQAMLLCTQCIFIFHFGYYTTDAIATSLLIARSWFVNYSSSFTKFMLKPASNYHSCQAIILDQ